MNILFSFLYLPITFWICDGKFLFGTTVYKPLILNEYTLRKKTVLKQYPFGTILENGTLFGKWYSFFLNNHVYPFCGMVLYKNSHGTVSNIKMVPHGDWNSTPLKCGSKTAPYNKVAPKCYPQGHCFTNNQILYNIKWSRAWKFREFREGGTQGG